MTAAPFPILAIASGSDAANRPIAFATDQAGILRRDDASGRHIRVRHTGIATAIAMSPRFATDGLVVAGIDGSVSISHDAGETWTDSPVPGLASPVAAIAISGFAAGGPIILVAALEDGVFRRDPDGRWHPSNTGLYLCRTNVVQFDESGSVWLGTDGGLFHSPISGRTWRDDLAADIDAEVTAIAVAGDVVAFGSGNGAIWCLCRGSGDLFQVGVATHDTEVLALDLTPEQTGVRHLTAVSTDKVWCWQVSCDTPGPAELAWTQHLPGDVTCASFHGPSQRRTMLLGRANGAIDRVMPGPGDVR